MTGAAASLCAAALKALGAIGGLNGCYEEAPVQAALPYATVELGPELDWGHKSGAGRELRLAVIVRDAGERPDRLRRLMQAAEMALADLSVEDGWELTNLVLMRSRTARNAGGWTGVGEYRARMLAGG